MCSSHATHALVKDVDKGQCVCRTYRPAALIHWWSTVGQHNYVSIYHVTKLLCIQSIFICLVELCLHWQQMPATVEIDAKDGFPKYL